MSRFRGGFHPPVMHVGSPTGLRHDGDKWVDRNGNDVEMLPLEELMRGKIPKCCGEKMQVIEQDKKEYVVCVWCSEMKPRA